VRLHNKFVAVNKRASTCALTDRWIPVIYRPEIGLVRMLFGHSANRIQGREEVSFSFHLFEEFVLSELLSGVPKLKEGLSQYNLMIYREDVTWLSMIEEMCKMVPQVLLPETKIHTVVYRDIQTATRALKAIGTAIGYMTAGLGSDRESLENFLQRIHADWQPPKDLEKAHVLDIWHLTYYQKSWLTRTEPFGIAGFSGSLAGSVSEWLEAQETKQLTNLHMLLHRYIVDRVVNKPSQDYSGWELEEALEFYIDDAVLLAEDTTFNVPKVQHEDVVGLWMTIKRALKLRGGRR